jgi:hypothetical protein
MEFALYKSEAEAGRNSSTVSTITAIATLLLQVTNYN